MSVPGPGPGKTGSRVVKRGSLGSTVYVGEGRAVDRSFLRSRSRHRAWEPFALACSTGSVGEDLLAQETFGHPLQSLASCNSTTSSEETTSSTSPFKNGASCFSWLPGHVARCLNIHMHVCPVNTGEKMYLTSIAVGNRGRSLEGESDMKQMVCSLEVKVHRHEKEVQTWQKRINKPIVSSEKMLILVFSY